jgi:TBC1 domain family member 2B
MNFIVAMALLVLEPEDAFWLLVAITEHHLNNYYDTGLIGAQVDQFILKDLIKHKAYDIHQHFEINEVDITSLTLNWFMAIFIDSVPFETLLRIWDCFLLEGSKVLFRFAIAILMINRESILTRTDTISMMKHVKDSTKNLIDVEMLFKVNICRLFTLELYRLLQVAFEDLRPFCHRQDIAVKQAYWTKILVDKVEKRHLSKEGFAKRDYVVSTVSRNEQISCSHRFSFKRSINRRQRWIVPPYYLEVGWQASFTSDILPLLL